MPALYFFRRENDNDDNNGLKAPSATDDDYYSYKQISVKVLKKISGGPFHFHCFHSEAGHRSRLGGKHTDRFLITVLVDRKIKIPA